MRKPNPNKTTLTEEYIYVDYVDKTGFRVMEQQFGPLWKYLVDDNITDIEYNGRALWVTNREGNRVRIKNEASGISKEVLEKIMVYISNASEKPFNQIDNFLDVDTEKFRIVAFNDNIFAGYSICIRKKVKDTGMNISELISTGYASKELIKLLVNCVIAKMNIVFCGEQDSEKIECAKFFAGFIPEYEKTVAINVYDSWNYVKRNPHKDAMEINVKENLTYAQALSMALYQQPQRLLLPELHENEVSKILECLTAGVNCITTVQCNDIRRFSSCLLAMMNPPDPEQMERIIYEYMDVVCVVKRRRTSSGVLYRYIDQVGFLYRENGQNRMWKLLKNGQIINPEVPEEIAMRFQDAEILKPFENDVIDLLAY